MVAIRRFSSNMFLKCFVGPIRNIVAHRDTMLPMEYRMANLIGFAIVKNDCGANKTQTAKSCYKRAPGIKLPNTIR
jgi:hypothetical protein